MSKSKLRSSPPLGQFRSKQSDEEELATFCAFVDELKKDPVQLRALVVKAGIITRAGNLTKAYKG